MTLHQALNEIVAEIEKKNFKAAGRLINSHEKAYGDNPWFLWQKAVYELSRGADKRLVVLPLFEKAYNGGLEELGFLRAYGALLIEFGIYAAACRVFGRIVQIKQDDIEGFINLAHVFSKTGNPVTAINTLKLAAKINRAHPLISTVYCGMATALMESGYQEESLEMYEKALEPDIKNIHFASEYLFRLNYVDITREKYFLLCQKYRTFWENEILNARPPFSQTGKIKIGFVSGDFYFHAVSFFISPLFENYDKNRFEIHLFSTLKPERYDTVTKAFMDQTDGWHDISTIGFQDAADLIKKEEISVLIDLAGHTNGGVSLEIFGSRPTPVQVAYCGYPNTTGLKSIDYRITDDICEPGGAQKYHSEKLFKIDGCFLCYQPRLEAIPECSFENPRSRPIVFGSFNNLAKMTSRTIKLWCDVVNAVPGSKLVIKHKYLNDPKLREITIARFVKNGLSADRIIIFDFNFKIKEHLTQYNKIDIALDSFPYNGTTTTCEALYMGVPVITILGDRHCSRVSASLLNAAGFGEFVAKDGEEFVKIAADLAGNTQKLIEVKQNLRERMQNSSLLDKKSFTRKWQNAILDMINEVKTMNKMKVSIIIPVYNSEKYIAECFYSILNQTEKNIEAIFVDDGSTDNSVEVMQKLIGENLNTGINFRIIKHKNNLNVSAARNAGIENASGDYIMFVDSDDVIAPHTVELMLGNARKYPIAEIILGGHLGLNEDEWSQFLSPDMAKQAWEMFCKELTFKENPCGMEVLSNETDKILKLFLMHQFYKETVSLFGVWATLYKTDFIRVKNIRFSEDLYQCEDIYFRYLCFKYATQALVEYTPVYFYRNRGDSYSHSDDAQYQRKLYAVLCLEKMSDDLVKKEEISRLLASWCFSWIKLWVGLLKTEKEKTLVPRYLKVLKKIEPFL